MHFSIKRSFLPPQSTLSTDHPRSRTRSQNHPPPLATPSSPDETACQPDRNSGSEARLRLGLDTGAARPELRSYLHDCAGGRAPIPRKPPPEKNQESRGDRLTRHTTPDLHYVQRSYRPTSTNDTPCPAWSGNRPPKKKKAIHARPERKEG